MAKPVFAIIVFQHLKLAVTGVIYSASFGLFLTLLGVVCFKEPLNASESIGVAMAAGSMFLFVRFA